MNEAIKRRIVFSSFENGIMRYIEGNFIRIVYILFLVVGGLLRIIASLMADGILHPDEIFQSMEMAHLMTYGSGWTPPEFQRSNPYVPSYAASRSWLFPLIFATLMRVGELLSLDYHTQTLVMIRLFLALNSTLLIPAVKKFTYQFTRDEITSVIAAVFVAIWFRIIEYTVRAFSNTFFLPLLFYGMAKALEITRSDDKMGIRDHLVIITCLGLTTYIRFDLGILLFSVFVINYERKSLRKYILMLMDGILAWIIGAIYDFSYYGIWFSVPINWFRFNIIENNSDIFGVTNVWFYIGYFVIVDYLWPWLLPLFILIARGIKRTGRDLKSERYVRALYLLALLSIIVPLILSPGTGDFLDVYNYLAARSFILIIIVLVVVLIYLLSTISFNISVEGNQLILYLRGFMMMFIPWYIYSNPFRYSHKELRFMIGGLIFLLILLAQTVILIANSFSDSLTKKHENSMKPKNMKEETHNKERRTTYSFTRPLIITVLIALVISQSIVGFNNNYHTEKFDDVNQALAYVGDKNDLRGVIVLSAWYLTGAYTYLHANDSVIIEFFSLQYQMSRSANIMLIENRLEVGYMNYFIIPDYELEGNGEIIDIAKQNGWQLDIVIYGSSGRSSEVWFLADYISTPVT